MQASLHISPMRPCIPSICKMNQLDTKTLGSVVQGQFAPIHFQEKSGVTA
jgi:hypothetical protein